MTKDEMEKKIKEILSKDDNFKNIKLTFIYKDKKK